MKCSLALSLLAVVVSFCGCASEGVRLSAVGPDNQLWPQARYALNAEGVKEASVIVEGWGRFDDRVDGRSTDTVRFRLTVENSSEDAVAIPLDRLSAQDDLGHRYIHVSDFLPGDQHAPTFLVQPGQRTSFESTFDTGAPGNLDVTGAISLAWGYSYRGAAIDHTTRFIPVRYVYRPEPVYFGVGFGYWHRWH